MEFKEFFQIQINIKDLFFIVALIWLFLTRSSRRRKEQKEKSDRKTFERISTLIPPEYINSIIGILSSKGAFSEKTLESLNNYYKIRGRADLYFYNVEIQRLKCNFDTQIGRLLETIQTTFSENPSDDFQRIQEKDIPYFKDLLHQVNQAYADFYRQARLL